MQEIEGIGEDVEKSEPLYIVGGNINWYLESRRVSLGAHWVD